MPANSLNWTFTRNSERNRLAQLNALAKAEPLGSLGYCMHVGLLALASLCGGVLYEAWWIASIVFSYLVVLTLEKWAAQRAATNALPSHYWPVLGLLFLRATIYNIIVVYVWAMDGDIFKFAAAALLVVATINIFVFHATHIEIIAAVMTPVWLGYVAITALSFGESGLTPDPFMFLLITICVVPYFLIALKSVHDQWTKYDVIQQSLNHSQKLDALGHLVAGVAHDFNNILTVTRGNAELLREQLGDDSGPLINEIVRASERGSTLSGQLLAFGRRTALSPEPIDVITFFEDSHALLKRVVPENIAVSFSAAPYVPPILVDPHQLETAIVNLAINARDALEQGGEIEISADRMMLHGQDLAPDATRLQAGEYVVIGVADNGVGIPDDLQDKVFDPFFTTKAAGKGSGLGLSMVIGFAEQSLGGVRLESKSGFGTRISLYLPAVRDTST